MLALAALAVVADAGLRPRRRRQPATAGGTYTIWDPYPQFDDSSDWVKLLDKCGTDAGVTVKRTGYDTTDLTNKALLAAQQGNSPDVLIVDNPVVSTLAEAGVLTTTDDNKLDTSAIDAEPARRRPDRRQDLRHPDRRQHPRPVLQQGGADRRPASTSPRSRTGRR